MREADIILTPLPQSDGKVKLRPALILKEMPGFKDFLVCGISTQLHQHINGFDEIIESNNSDFKQSGLLNSSLIRLGFLAVIPSRNIRGSIGNISNSRHERLLQNLSKHLLKK